MERIDRNRIVVMITHRKSARNIIIRRLEKRCYDSLEGNLQRVKVIKVENDGEEHNIIYN